MISKTDIIKCIQLTKQLIKRATIKRSFNHNHQYGDNNTSYKTLYIILKVIKKRKTMLQNKFSQ